VAKKTGPTHNIHNSGIDFVLFSTVGANNVRCPKLETPTIQVL